MQQYLSPNWSTPPNIRAYITTRNGGFSQKPYTNFNLGDHVGDNPKTVQKNRTKLKSDLKLINEPIWLKQTHSTKVICLDNQITKSQPEEADASYTTQPNVICAVLTADCLPLLLAAKDGSVVAAIHAGWQGLAAGIIENTLLKLKTITKLEDLLVWLGPAIGPKAFLVKDDVRQQFLQKDPKTELAIHKHDENTWLVDMYAIAKQRLHAYNVTKIYGSDFCTYTDQELFFSYRRDQQITGRMASLIYKLPQ